MRWGCRRFWSWTVVLFPWETFERLKKFGPLSARVLIFTPKLRSAAFWVEHLCFFLKSQTSSEHVFPGWPFSWQVVLTVPRRMTLSPDASYLLSGGMGALGLVTAQALAEEGAKSLLLMSRRGGFQSWRAEKVCLFRICGPRIGILWICCFQSFLLEISEMELPCELDLLTGLIPLTNLAGPF